MTHSLATLQLYAHQLNEDYLLPLFLTLLLISACGPANPNQQSPPPLAATSTNIPIKEFDDTQYPDNPDIPLRSVHYSRFSHDSVVFRPGKKMGYFDVVITPANSESDTIVLEELYLLEWIPALPEFVRKDSFLADVCIQNQEFNRQQVKLNGKHFKLRGAGEEKGLTTRIDLARNCLNGGLWEVMTFTDEEGTVKPLYHGWFDFPENLYGELFEQRNDLSFDQYKNLLFHWKDLPSKAIDLTLLRTVQEEQPVTFEAKLDQLYPVIDECAKKASNIVYPIRYTSMQDFLQDSTQFATFSPPGLYETKNPKTTQLGRLSRLDAVTVRKTTPVFDTAQTCLELELNFSDATRTTRLYIGGLDPTLIPALPEAAAHQGFKMPIGVANHSYYETYEYAIAHPSETNPYFSFLTDGEGRWLDSHTIGIDGPLIHFDDQDPTLLHLWLLSFERHALVGHYLIRVE